MNPRALSFRLHPFPAADPAAAPPAELLLAGSLALQAGADPALELSILLKGSLEQLRLAGPADAPCRRDDLWRTTCFEFFLAAPRESRYWEFNLSPRGDWNVYRFNDYRSGAAPESFYTGLPFHIQMDRRRLQLRLRCPLPPALRTATGLQASVTAVIESRRGALSYWALTHPGTAPDFHRRSGFTLALEPPDPLGSGTQEFLQQPLP